MQDLGECLLLLIILLLFFLLLLDCYIENKPVKYGILTTWAFAHDLLCMFIERLCEKTCNEEILLTCKCGVTQTSDFTLKYNLLIYLVTLK